MALRNANANKNGPGVRHLEAAALWNQRLGVRNSIAWDAAWLPTRC